MGSSSGRTHRPATDAHPGTVRDVASRSHRDHGPSLPFDPRAATDGHRDPRTVAGRSTDSDWERRSRPPAAAHHLNPARQRPGSSPRSSFPSTRVRTRAPATRPRGRPAVAARRAGDRRIAAAAALDLDRTSNQMRRDALPPPLELSLVEEASTGPRGAPHFTPAISRSNAAALPLSSSCFGSRRPKSSINFATAPVHPVW
jgi:hypothetical protein